MATTDEESRDRDLSKTKKKERTKKGHKKHKKHSSRRRHRDDSESSGDEESHHRSRKRETKKRRKSHYSSDEESDRKRKKKTRSKEYSSDSNTSSDDDDDDSSRYSRERRRDRKKRRKDKKPGSASLSTAPAMPTFGQYGIIKASDMTKKQRSFEIWMAEVKGIQHFAGPKWELLKYFEDYMEDYNTATLPHIKYYDYDDWEMKEYQKQQSSKSISGARADELRHQEEMKQRAQEKRQADLQLLRQTMNADKIQDMKHKQQLQSELAHAFKTGDIEAQQRIKRKLEPEK